MHVSINKNYIKFKDYKAKCAIGQRGINIKKEEGDLITPKGIFKIKDIFYRKDKLTSLKTKFKKKIIKKNMGWCDDPKSKKYNQLIRYPFKYNSEKLYRSDNTYDIILVLDYNMTPVKANKGSAIFIHVSKKGYPPTKGCIALKKNDLIKLIGFINKKTKVKIF